MLSRISTKPQPQDVELRWVSDYWDGPLSGLASWKGRDYWFEITESEPSEEGEWPPASLRRYWLIPLTDAELMKEWKKHRLFERHVGTHTCYRGNRRLVAAEVKPRAEWEVFYRQYDPEDSRGRSYTQREAVRWFEIKQAPVDDPKLGSPCDSTPYDSV
jgi:hypothetical protein